MKHLIALLFATILLVPAVLGQNVLSPRATAEHGNVSVDYGQPSKRGRVVFGGLEPYGQVWRTGANEATVITFKKDGTFGGKPVKAGKYTLYTIPREKEWEVILNSKLEQWGAYDYEKIKGNDVLHVTVPSGSTKEVVEKFTITVMADAMVMEWDQTRVSVPIKF
ncbi:MAG TPA: DUF2911 domain-containing protein [Flavipsychrobacter sp.]|nr:DUF2911 domain-containing protein [Flavipsychrobacter sp.]